MTSAPASLLVGVLEQVARFMRLRPATAGTSAAGCLLRIVVSAVFARLYYAVACVVFSRAKSVAAEENARVYDKGSLLRCLNNMLRDDRQKKLADPSFVSAFEDTLHAMPHLIDARSAAVITRRPHQSRAMSRTRKESQPDFPARCPEEETGTVAPVSNLVTSDFAASEFMPIDTTMSPLEVTMAASRWLRSTGPGGRVPEVMASQAAPPTPEEESRWRAAPRRSRRPARTPSELFAQMLIDQQQPRETTAIDWTSIGTPQGSIGTGSHRPAPAIPPFNFSVDAPVFCPKRGLGAHPERVGC